MNYQNVQAPNTNQSGKFLRSNGLGNPTAYWGNAFAHIYLPYTYAVQGTLAVTSGSTEYLPEFWFPIYGAQTATLAYVRAAVRAGTATISLAQNGTAIAGLSAISVTTTPTNFSPTNTTPVANLDAFQPSITAVSGSDGLSLTLIFEVSA